MRIEVLKVRKKNPTKISKTFASKTKFVRIRDSKKLSTNKKSKKRQMFRATNKVSKFAKIQKK